MNGKGAFNFNTISLILLVLLSGIFAFSGYRQTPEAASDKRFYFPNSGGAIVFNHQQHSDQSEGCESCHHHLYNAELSSPCVECHDDDVSADDFSHAELKEIEDHECGFCHALDAVRKPQNCRQCHPQTANEAFVVNTCSSCHEDSDEDYADLDISHEEILEIHEDDCSSCHQLQTTSAVYHLQCISCHEKEDAQVFGKAAAEWECQSCHLK